MSSLAKKYEPLYGFLQRFKVVMIATGAATNKGMKKTSVR